MGITQFRHHSNVKNNKLNTLHSIGCNGGRFYLFMNLENLVSIERNAGAFQFEYNLGYTPTSYSTNRKLIVHEESIDVEKLIERLQEANREDLALLLTLETMSS